MWPDLKRQPLYAALVVILLLGATAWEVTAVAGKMKQYRTIGKSASAPPQITVSGEGKVRAAPDVAIVTAGFTELGADARTVQSAINRRAAALVDAVKQAGVAQADIQTVDFSVSPQYAYGEGKAPRVTGYGANQSVEIRIRDLDRINEVLGVVGDVGATNIGGLQFAIDDPKELRAQARQAAIAQARQEAARIADALGVRLGDPVSFKESGGQPIYPMARGLALSDIGGEEFDAPAIERGTNEITSHVTVTYELH
ncbi:SIMPL domain-containing protein [Candidatus Uhrbacteria bacterium]|nr:SIMPL domain-containing protein [Candidatus Uhrbacteria bacterium]